MKQRSHKPLQRKYHIFMVHCGVEHNKKLKLKLLALYLLLLFFLELQILFCFSFPQNGCNQIVFNQRFGFSTILSIQIVYMHLHRRRQENNRIEYSSAVRQDSEVGDLGFSKGLAINGYGVPFLFAHLV